MDYPPFYLVFLLFVIGVNCNGDENCNNDNPPQNCTDLATQIPYNPATTKVRTKPKFTQDNIRRFYQGVTKGNSSKDDMMMRFQPFNGMDENLLTAPYTVQLLATLCLIAARTKPDFRLDDTESNIDFKYLVAPSSFRASLGQIGNEGFYAFREAHNAMHDIQIRTSQFKGYLNDILNIVFKKV
jgi:hypothetical protein